MADVLAAQDEGSRIAPWARPDDPYPPAKLELPKLKVRAFHCLILPGAAL
jgi:hypothetical protein